MREPRSDSTSREDARFRLMELTYTSFLPSFLPSFLTLRLTYLLTYLLTSHKVQVDGGATHVRCEGRDVGPCMSVYM